MNSMSLFDFRYLKKKNEYSSLLDNLIGMIEDAYAFIPFQFYKNCESDLERASIESTDGHFHCFKLKKGKTIKVFAR